MRRVRPASIVWFERLYLGSLLIGVVQSVIGWKDAIALASPAFLLTVQAVVFAFLVGLILLVSRERSNVAKWINVVLFVLGLPVIVSLLVTEKQVGSALLAIVQTLMQGIGLGLLFTASARAWLGRTPGAEAELRTTFD